MIRFLRLMVAGLLLAVAAWAATKPFPQELSDLRADPTVRYGRLSNGLRYAVKANAEPKGRAALRVLIDAGSFMEKDSQQGLAHFLEHMSFNGSTHYPPGTLIEFFQRMGMSFGGDTNAFTSVDQTVYQIDLPNTQPATLDEGLKVMTDYVGGLLLLAPEIEKERGVILAEKLSRDSVEERNYQALCAFLYPETLAPKRFVIGREEVIRKAGREEFLDFYNTWYRPDLISVVLVGDFDAVAVEQKVRETFSPCTARAPELPAPPVGRPTPVEGLKVGYHHEPEAPATQVLLFHHTPYSKKTYKAAEVLELIPLNLAMAMFNQRMAELSKKEGAPFSQGGMSEGQSYNILREVMLGLVCKPEQWAEAVAVLEQELRRALSYGFQEAELRMAVSNKRNAYEQAVKTASTRRSSVIADQLVSSLQSEQVYTSDEDDLALVGPALDKVSAKDCVEALRKAWGTEGRLLFVMGNCVIPGDSAQALRAAYEASAGKPLEATAQLEVAPWAYTDFGVPGKIASRTLVEDLDITQIRFENGVRLNLKRTDFEKGQVRVRVSVGDGLLVQPVTQPGLASYAYSVLMAGGLGKHSVDELERILAGRNISTGFAVVEDSLALGGSTTREDLLLQLQLFTAVLTDAGYRPEAARQYEKIAEETYTSLEHTIEGPMQLQVPSILARGDSRMGLVDRETMKKRTQAELKAWLSPQFERGRLEISVVGDIDLEATVAAVASTFGALPKRSEEQPEESLRKVSCPEEPLSRDFEVDTQIEKASLTLIWPAHTDCQDYRRIRRMSLLADVFGDRLRVKVREELGDSYSPEATLSISGGFREYGFLQTTLLVAPEKAQRIREVVLGIAEQLRKDGLTKDELARAKLPDLSSKKESLRNNSYWLSRVLDQCQLYGYKLEAARNRISDTEAVTVEELNTLAGEVLGAKRAFQFVVRPGKPK